MSRNRKKPVEGDEVTADTITDEQIRELWRAKLIDSNMRNRAIRTYRGGAGSTWRREMRARCAGLITAQQAARATHLGGK